MFINKNLLPKNTNFKGSSKMVNKNEEQVHELKLSLKDSEFTSYEKARMIGSRALQISQGAKPLITFTEEEMASFNYNPIEIAKREFDLGIIPLSIKRSLPHEGK